MTIEELHQLLLERKEKLPEGSSSTRLFKGGFSTILPKLNEEIFEVGLALETQSKADLALEISQSYYYLLCLHVFLDQPLSHFEFQKKELETGLSKHELAKRLSRHSAMLCHQPSLENINECFPIFNAIMQKADLTLNDIYQHL